MKFKFTLLTLFCVGCCQLNLSFAQNKQFVFDAWTKSVAPKISSAESSARRQALADKILYFKLEQSELQSYLRDFATQRSSATINIPLSDGTLQAFMLQESEVMSPELAAKYLEIKSYFGTSIGNNPNENSFIRCEFNSTGFHAAIFRHEKNIELIEPESDHYVCYSRKDVLQKEERFACNSLHPHPQTPHHALASERVGDCKIRKFRLAVACTGEYTAAHGGTVVSALGDIVTTVNRINGILSREIGVNMTLVANNDQIIYTNAATDPYSNTNTDLMLTQNQATIDAKIGTSNYDLGHLFSNANLGGVAYVGTICYAPYKAQALSTSTNTSGDNFDVDLVAHEFGHQFGAEHSFYAANGSCANRVVGSLFEVGSGSTIMSYSGICAPYNVQVLSDDYFHAGSLAQISDYLLQFDDCSTTQTTLTPPTIPTLNNYTIPQNTPFSLSQVATASGGYTLTYNWEQFDIEDGFSTPPDPTATGGPTFRSRKPTTSSNRYFPNFTDFVTPTLTVWEKLSTVARNLNMRLTVRAVDGQGRGCTSEKNMLITVNNSSEFKFIAPIGMWNIANGNQLTLSWSVGATNVPPISTSQLDLFATVDGGVTLRPLATNIPNTGSATVVISGLSAPLAAARLVLKAKNNVFYAASTGSTISTAQNPLPIELLTFQAKAIDKKIRLQWITANEQGNFGFQLEKSIYPDKGFDVLGFVSANAPNGGGNTYGLDDAEVLAGIHYYYKLRQIDQDGRATTYPVVSAIIGSDSEIKNGLDVYIHPNPAQDVVKISVLGEVNEDIRVDLTAFDGKTMLDEKMTLDNSNQCKINVFGLPNGIYALKLTYKYHRIIKKLIIQSDK